MRRFAILTKQVNSGAGSEAGLCHTWETDPSPTNVYAHAPIVHEKYVEVGFAMLNEVVFKE